VQAQVQQAVKLVRAGGGYLSMKQALVDDQLVVAAAGAPATAICPRCEGVVELRDRQGTYFWRHVKLPQGGCEPQRAAVPDPAQVTMVTGDGVAVNVPERPSRQVGAFVIELYPDEGGAYGRHLKLRNPSAEEVGEPSGMVIYPSEVRLLAKTLIDAAADLVDLVVGDQAQGER
jgi:hypothetical protein